MVFLTVKLSTVHNSSILICGTGKAYYLKAKKAHNQIKDVFLSKNPRIILVIKI